MGARISAWSARVEFFISPIVGGEFRYIYDDPFEIRISRIVDHFSSCLSEFFIIMLSPSVVRVVGDV